jgi:ABC-2 type transport system ATP-binding protein
MATALEIRGLEKGFAHFSLGPIDMTVPEGAIYGFVGPNGSGKTTTIDLILGLGTKTAGDIRVLGLDHLKDEVAVKRQTGYASPELNYQAWRKVRRAIQFAKGFYPTWDDSYCLHLLERFDLGLEERIQMLSFGARTKLALVIAMAWRPRLLLLDEPTVGLDAISKQHVFAELLSLVRDGDRTVLISSHNLNDIERLTDHIGMIRNGQMLFEGLTADVVERFRMVNFTTDDGRLSQEPGVFVQSRNADRWLALIDQQRTPLDRLPAFGARDVTATPVSLEDLFVALGRD